MNACLVLGIAWKRYKCDVLWVCTGRSLLLFSLKSSILFYHPTPTPKEKRESCEQWHPGQGASATTDAGALDTVLLRPRMQAPWTRCFCGHGCRHAEEPFIQKYLLNILWSENSLNLTSYRRSIQNVFWERHLNLISSSWACALLLILCLVSVPGVMSFKCGSFSASVGRVYKHGMGDLPWWHGRLAANWLVWAFLFLSGRGKRILYKYMMQRTFVLIWKWFSACIRLTWVVLTWAEPA